jgi:hypothetical protein
VSRCLFTDEARSQVLASVSLGVSLDDSARAAGVSPRTLRSWIERGRREDAGAYAAFVQGIETARQAARARPEPLTAEEHRLAVSDMVRAGSVTAAKLYWELLKADPPDEADESEPASVIDMLARKRREAGR